ncbi:MAG: class C beta-lactamase [Pseudolabrys sp.]|nr:class C beta-lactamase [Pseudolabrys sp.]MDP2295277.1 class C beta-lactamase [Pseudolabrys sp.]
MRLNFSRAVGAALGVATLLSPLAQAASPETDVGSIVAQTIQPLMQSHGIPGMAVGIVAGGRRAVYNFGVMLKASGQPVTGDTLFEIGSVSKTFTATLAAYAEGDGRLSLSDMASKYLPVLRGSAFDRVSLLNLGTHTTGGMPLQFPGDVKSDEQAMRYFRDWNPRHAPGAVRTYANPGIGLLGMIAAKSLNEDFDTAMQRRVFAGAGLKRTFLIVPATERTHYAQGYTKADAPARMSPGVLASPTYGVRTTADDLLRFIEANMGLLPIGKDLQRAIDATHTGYYTVGPVTQDLIWEQYRYPVELADLVAGNSDNMAYKANDVARIEPPLPPQADVLVNKTGSTNGFGAYVAFVPVKKIGIVILANKNYPNAARVTAAHAILTRLVANPPAN